MPLVLLVPTGPPFRETMAPAGQILVDGFPFPSPFYGPWTVCNRLHAHTYTAKKVCTQIIKITLATRLLFISDLSNVTGSFI